MNLFSYVLCIKTHTNVWKGFILKKKVDNESQKVDSRGVFDLGEEQNDGTDRQTDRRMEDSSAYKGDRGQLANPSVTWPSA